MDKELSAENLRATLDETLPLLHARRFADAIDRLLPFARNNLAEAFVEVGLLFELSATKEKDLSGEATQAALHWYRRSVETKNERFGYLGMGRILITRGSTESEKQKGVEFLSVAAERGVPEAATLLGVCYENGLGVSVDQDCARTYYSLAAREEYVWPLVLQSKLEYRSGNYLKWIALRCSAAMLAWKIAGKNPRDERLWNITRANRYFDQR